MTRLRDDIRSAFEREQAALGDVGDARHRLMHGAMVNRDIPAIRGRQWAAGVAAVLITAIVITTFALVRANTHSSVVPAATPSPRAQASPTPLTNELSVSDSTPVIVYLDPAKAGQVDGMTWDGKLRGKITGGSLATGNPANSLFGVGNQIVDRHGNVVATGSYGAKFWSATWADDETHYCLMSPFDNPADGGIPTTLEIGAPGQPLKAIAPVGTLHNQTSVTVAACSVLADRAVVVQSGGQGPFAAQYWVLQLSTGKILWTHSFDLTKVSVQVVASRDGMYVAENLQQEATRDRSTVYGPDGKAIAHLSWIEGFSWDGSLAVVDSGYGTSPVNLVAWRTSEAVFKAPSGYGLLGMASEPGGDEIALYTAIPQQGTPGNVYVVNSSGHMVFQIDGAVPTT